MDERVIPITIIILVLSTFTLVTYAVLSTIVTINTGGTLQTIGIEANVQTINWGKLTLGETKNVIIKVRATGNTPVYLTIEANNTAPVDLMDYVTFGSDYQGQLIGNSWFNITLSLYQEGFSDFSLFNFDVVITGEQ